MIPKINLLNDALTIKQLKDLKKANERLDELKYNYIESNKKSTEIISELHSRFDELKLQLQEILSYRKADSESRAQEVNELRNIWNTRLDE